MEEEVGVGDEEKEPRRREDTGTSVSLRFGNLRWETPHFSGIEENFGGKRAGGELLPVCFRGSYVSLRLLVLRPDTGMQNSTSLAGYPRTVSRWLPHFGSGQTFKVR